jgi:hypothetical protein
MSRQNYISYLKNKDYSSIFIAYMIDNDLTPYPSMVETLIPHIINRLNKKHDIVLLYDKENNLINIL